MVVVPGERYHNDIRAHHGAKSAQPMRRYRQQRDAAQGCRRETDKHSEISAGSSLRPGGDKDTED